MQQQPEFVLMNEMESRVLFERGWASSYTGQQLRLCSVKMWQTLQDSLLVVGKSLKRVTLTEGIHES